MALKAHLGPQAPRFGQIESRTEERRSLFLEASGALPGGLEANVLIHNISAAGLLLETELSLNSGDRLLLDLPELGA
ncbi:MAG: XRE family transcriptional regulator, partial [Pseudomonadota bacterium]